MARRKPPIAQPRQYQFRRRVIVLLTILIILLSAILLIVIIFVLVLPLIHPSNTGGTGSSSGSSAIAVNRAPDTEMIGISGGAYRFDSQSSAEPLIYQEDSHILNTHHRFMTVVVGTILTGTFAKSGRDSLQGVYVEQKEYNDQCLNQVGCLPVRVLIANSGSGSITDTGSQDTASTQVAYATKVAEQIVQARRQDSTIVGVVGWPASSDLFYANATLGNAHIPVVSPTALLDTSPSPYPYIFSVAPSNTRQGTVGAYYAENSLHAQSAAVFVDPVDRYSQSLADAFEKRFQNDNYTITRVKNYQVGSPQSVSAGLPDVLSTHPDLIYFAGHASDIRYLLEGLPSCTADYCPQVLGGDGLYELDYNLSDPKQYLYRLHFTAFAYPDEWGILSGSQTTPRFFSEYPAAFNPNGDHIGYGYTRPNNDVILSYDAMGMLLETATKIFNDQQTTLSPDALQKALTSQDRQGISGRIAYNGSGDPTDKAMVMLFFDKLAQIHQDTQCFGTFLQPSLVTTTSKQCTSTTNI